MRFSRRAGVAASIAILSLAACNGGGASPNPTGVTNAGNAIPAVGGSATPGASSAPGATASPATVATAAPGNGSSSNGDLSNGLSLACNSAIAPIGSNVVIFNVDGNVTGTTFAPSTTTAQSNGWIKTRVVLDVTPTPIVSPLPTFTPFAVPTETPSPTIPVLLYSGSYTVKNTNGSVDTSGCALFAATVNGAPLNTSSSNATAFGSPLIADNATYDTTNVATGKFSAFSIGNLSSNGGSGSFTLDNGETGTISLNSRQSFNYPALELQSRASLKRQATSIFRR